MIVGYWIILFLLLLLTNLIFKGKKINIKDIKVIKF